MGVWCTLISDKSCRNLTFESLPYVAQSIFNFTNQEPYWDQLWLLNQPTLYLLLVYPGNVTSLHFLLKIKILLANHNEKIIA